MSIKLKDYMEGGDLWGAIRTIKSYPFLLTDEDVQKMNNLTVFKHGSRPMFFTGDIQFLAELLVTEYDTQWTNLLAAVASSDVTAVKKETTTDTTVATEQKTNSRTDTNKVSAFDSPDLLVNDGSDSEGSEDVSGNKSRNSEKVVSSVSDIYKNLDVMKKNDIISTVINDVVGFSTLSIF